MVPETLSERAYFDIRNRILRGYFAMGSPLVEESMTALLGISRTPLRTAMGRLLAEGFLVQGEDRTLRIPTINRKDLSETFEARRSIESAAVSLACLRASKEQVTKLEGLIWSERDAYRNREQVLISAMDRMFHNLLAEMSGN
jgi:DNA-binding GntR family transcriptional regulator